MFVYEDGLPVDYINTGTYTPEMDLLIRQEMMKWINSLPGQVRIRQGKADRMRGQDVNLKRMENE